MAVPDPHMDELEVMSYHPRSRSCKERYRIPRRQDFIEVLWCMDHLPDMPNRWCAAEVLHISCHPGSNNLASAVVLYMPGDTWEEQIQQVEFLNTYRLRCVVENDDQGENDSEVQNNEVCTSVNENPLLAWRFRNGLLPESDDESHEEDWEQAKSRQRTSHSLSISHTENMTSDSVHAEIASLRDGHAAVVVEVEKLKRMVVLMSKEMEDIRNKVVRQKKCVSSECVLPRLKNKLVLRVQGGRKQTTGISRKRFLTESEQTHNLLSVDGLHCGIIRTRVECSLHQFESISRRISATSPTEDVFFFPQFSFTQLPLLCSSTFRIAFRKFSQLCNAIGMASAADQKEIARKCGKGSRGELLRMMGTYDFDENDIKSAATFYPGTSCGFDPAAYLNRTNQLPTSSNNVEPRSDIPPATYQTFTRKTREWDSVDGRYVHGLTREIVTLSQITDKATELEAFSLVWKRATDVVGRVWSESVYDNGEVFGWLEICLPFIQTQGRQLCEEVGGRINDDIWDEILVMK